MEPSLETPEPRSKRWLYLLPIGLAAFVLLALVLIFATEVHPPLPDVYAPAHRQSGGFYYDLNITPEQAEALILENFPDARPTTGPLSPAPEWLIKQWQTDHWLIELRGKKATKNCTIDFVRQRRGG